MMAWSLGFASVGAILFWSTGFLFNFTEPKIMAMIIGVSVAWHFRSGRDIPDKIMLAALVYGACFLPLVPFSRHIPMTLVGAPGIFNCSLLASTLCASGLLLASKVENPMPLRKSIMIAGILASLLGLAQAFGIDPFRMTGFPTNERAVSTLGSPVDLGSLMVALLSIQPNPLLFLGIWSAHSRGAWIGAIVALVPVRFRMAAFVVATSIGMFSIYWGNVTKDIQRREVFRIAATHISLKGTGPGTFAYTFFENRSAVFGAQYHDYKQAHAHNSILEALSTKGLLGLLSLLAFLIAPEMAGLWTVSMFNPITFEVVFVACVLVGLNNVDHPSATS